MINAAFKLQDSGFSREQVEALTEFMSGSVATKEDVTHLEDRIEAQGERLEGKIETTAVELRGEVKEDIAHLDGKITALRGELKEDIAHLDGKISEIRTELKYIRWIGAVIVVGVLVPLIRDFLF